MKKNSLLISVILLVWYGATINCMYHNVGIDNSLLYSNLIHNGIENPEMENPEKIITRSVQYLKCLTENVTGSNIDEIASKTQLMFLALPPAKAIVLRKKAMDAFCARYGWHYRPYCLQTLSDHTNTRNVLAISPDDTLLAVASASSLNGLSFAEPEEDPVTLSIWNTTTWQCTKAIEFAAAKEITSLAFSPDGKILIYASEDGNIYLRNTKNWDLIQTIAEHNDEVNSVTFSNDGDLCASASHDGTIKIWDVKNWYCIQTLVHGTHKDAVDAVAFSSDSRMLASAARDGSIKLWNTKDWQGEKVFKYSKATKLYEEYDVSLERPEEPQINDSYYNDHQLYEPITATNPHDEEQSLETSDNEDEPDSNDEARYESGATTTDNEVYERADIVSLAFSNNNKFFAAVLIDGTVQLWNTSNWQKIPLNVPQSMVTEEAESISFSSDSKLFAVASAEGTIKIYNLPSSGNPYIVESPIPQAHNAWIESMTFFKDNTFLAAVSMDGNIKIWGNHFAHILCRMAFASSLIKATPKELKNNPLILIENIENTKNSIYQLRDLLHSKTLASLKDFEVKLARELEREIAVKILHLDNSLQKFGYDFRNVSNSCPHTSEVTGLKENNEITMLEEWPSSNKVTTDETNKALVHARDDSHEMLSEKNDTTHDSKRLRIT